MAKAVKLGEQESSKWGEEDHLEVSKQKTFSQMIFELLSERNPNSEELKLFDLMLNLSIDHGPQTPSAIVTIEASKQGKTISEAVSEGILQINDSHGGAIEPAMENLYKVNQSQSSVGDLIKDYIDQDKKLPGFGHRIYKDIDPRARFILDSLQEIGGSEKFSEIEREFQSELEKQTGKHLPINIDGAIAVVLCSMGFESKTGKAFFLIARTPGLCAQFLNNS